MEPLQERELILLTKDISHTKFAELCDALGFSFTTGQKILATHLNYYDVAIQQLLMEWKTKQTDATQSRSILASKLREIGLGGLGDKLSHGAYQPNPNQCDPRNPKTPPIQHDSDIYSMKISDSLTVGRCREKLEKKYLNSFCKVQMAPWDPNAFAELNDLHTVVTIMKRDSHGKKSREKHVLQGSVSEVFSTKVDGRLPVRILISAPAGRGKTTAVAKMAYDWANRVRGSSLENLPLLFVVKLRNASKLTSIAEEIRSQLLSDVDDLTEEKLHSFMRRNQNMCHIILDGLDEYAGISANQGLGSNIVSVMLWEEYTECRVLITTRPHLENFFNQGELPRVYTKMWIEGFSRLRSREYIDKFFARISNPSHGQDLKVFLERKPLINELLITPLFCLMICHLWSKGMLENETATQTELLDRVNLFLMHHANARSTSPGKITTEELRKIICELGEVALAGLLDDAKKLVFTSHDFISVPAVLDKACEIGIISRTAVQVTGFPQTHETSFSSIEFYHKLAQEHSAGKCLAAKTNKYLLLLKMSKLDRVLRKIRTNIGDYENLIRFAAGTENSLCIRIMEAILSNSSLAESERYRILLDCSSETSGTEGSVSSLVQRCVTAQRIFLKSPTVYTIVGMQNLPGQLKKQVRQLRLEGCVMSDDLTNGLWSCLESSFSRLHTLTISDSSLSFPRSPPMLLSVTKLHARGVTSQSYEGLLSSLPGLKEIDVTIDDDVEENTSENTDTKPVSQSGDQHFPVNIKLGSLPSYSRDKKSESRETLAELDLLIREPTENCQRLQMTGMKGQDEETLVNLFVKSTQLKSLNLEFLAWGSLDYKRNTDKGPTVTLGKCQLSTEMTVRLWTCLRSFPSLSELTISDSSLSFPPSPPELTSVTKLIAKRVTSQSYEGLLSSLPGLQVIDIIMDDAERDVSQITAGLRRTGGQLLTRITLEAPTLLRPKKNRISRETMKRLGTLIKDQTNSLQVLAVSDENSGDEEDLVEDDEEDLVEDDEEDLVEDDEEDLVEDMAVFRRTEGEQLARITTETPSSLQPKKNWVSRKTIKDETNSLQVLAVSDENSGGEEDLVEDLAVRRRTEGEQLARITLEAPTSLQPKKNWVSRETMRRLGTLIKDQTNNLQMLAVSGVNSGDEEDLVALIECCRHAKALDYLVLLCCGSKSGGRLESYAKDHLIPNERLMVWISHESFSRFDIEKYQLSTEMTIRLWSSLSVFTSLSTLTISDSSLSFPPSPPQLTSVTLLKTERVTSQSYVGLLSSLPGLEDIKITIDDAERDISQITACLRRTGGQQLRRIILKAHRSLPQEKKNVSRETMRGLGLLIREQTKNLRTLWLDEGKCTDEEDLVHLIECCRHVKAMQLVSLGYCGTKKSGRVDSHLKSLHSSGYRVSVQVWHDTREVYTGKVSHIH